MQAATLGAAARFTFATPALKSLLGERCTRKEVSSVATSVQRTHTWLISIASARIATGATGRRGVPSSGYNWLLGMISFGIDGLDQRRKVVAPPKFSKKSRRI